jgi:hypothetical protein
MPQRDLSRSFTWMYCMRPRARHHSRKTAPEIDFGIRAAIAPPKNL